MEKIVILANRLAEAILFDWDKEEIIKLAKEVAVACHENIEFVSLVKRMREAQKSFNNIRFIDKSSESYKDAKKSRKQLESEVDEWFKKLN